MNGRSTRYRIFLMFAVWRPFLQIWKPRVGRGDSSRGAGHRRVRFPWGAAIGGALTELRRRQSNSRRDFSPILKQGVAFFFSWYTLGETQAPHYEREIPR
jgi:hypothetical protein